MEECPDSNYQSDPVTTRRKHDLLGGNVVYKYDTDVLNNTASVSDSQQTHFLGVGEPIGDVNRFEQKAVICGTTHGHHSLPGQASLPLGSL